ncbi:sulfatase-like hydrolase/transferase [Akkermansiaceae bacterium]|nr:sulfatase-like hydrolase/transferase [Akkermansiaceae bacterium]
MGKPITCAVLALVSFCSLLAAAQRPNVLFIITDDQNHDTIGALGNDRIRTPHTDRLVAEGVAFTNAYIMGGSSPAVCSPSRACLMTGRTLWNIECQSLWGFEISGKFRTLPQVFREDGFETFATGKNEPGRSGAFARSFSAGDKILFRGMTRSQYNMPLCPFSPEGDYSPKTEAAHEGKHSAEIYADAFIDFLGKQKGDEKPYFAYVSFQTPHDPRQCPEEFRAMYKDGGMQLPASFMPEHPFDNGMLKIRDEQLAPFPRTEAVVRKHTADYYATITHTDEQIGRMLDALDESGERDNTIIVFTSDNGLALGRHGLMGKQNIYDHSVHVPFIVAGPGIPKGERRAQLCYMYDIYPTLCEIAGIAVPDTVQFRSMVEVIKEPTAKFRDSLYFAFMSWQRAVRDERFKLIEYCVGEERHTQLFDLVADPNETKNLAADPAHMETRERLRALLKEERLLLNDGNTPYEFSDLQGKEFWSRYEAEELR